MLSKFIKDIRSSPDVSIEFVSDGLEKLLRQFVKENLEESSDISYNETLGKSIIGLFDVSELRGSSCNEYVVRKYVRSILKQYVSEVNKARPINITDHVKFGVQMETVGLNIGFTSETNRGIRSVMPDGNVVVLSGLLALVLVLFFKK